MKKRGTILTLAVLCAVLDASATDDLAKGFASPPPSARPWVYWYFMDGNLSREGMTADLEAMREGGIGGAIFLEVDLDLPRGAVKFMSPEWRALFAHAVHEAERLGIEIALGSGPGWCGTGGPWVKPEDSMQHLVAAETNVLGPTTFDALLPRPEPRPPFFGESTLTPELKKQWHEFYQDVAVLAFPTPDGNQRLPDVDEKALYQRAPYSSQPGVKSFLPMAAEYPAWPAEQCVRQEQVLDLTARMTPGGRLKWEVPPGKWTLLRFGRTSTGQITRPAPEPGLGFETDKFSIPAVKAHFERFVGTLLRDINSHQKGPGGLTTLHLDSWEMSSQNWSKNFPAEFRRRRGYDPVPFFPAYTGRVVGDLEKTERFLWDVRRTSQELVIANHVSWLKNAAHAKHLSLSVEPYDMNPNGDLTLGAVADVPMGEFWWKGFNTTYSVIEATSIAHTVGRRIVAAESFTSEPGEDWRAYPGNIKALGDWAFAAGINRLVFHRYQHQPWLDRWPGMQMGPYGVHWERTQTWWPMALAYHTYLARCQFMLRQGSTVADILFLAPEGAPHVFRPPPSATLGDPPDRRGYNFDGCAPETLLDRTSVHRGRIVFPGGTSYRLLVLPDLERITPNLLRKVQQLIRDGATVIGPPPRKSPSLAGYPKCDAEVRKISAELWGDSPDTGKGHLLWGPEFSPPAVRKAALPSLENAKWIWYDEADPATTAPLGKRRFGRDLEVPADAVVQRASLLITADNSFVLTINGQEVGTGNDFHRLWNFDLTTRLRAGTNTLAVRATNGGEKPNPAGFLAALEVHLRDGRLLRWQSDRTWTASMEPETCGKAARELGAYGMPPWGKPTCVDDQDAVSTPYPPYDALAKLLQDFGVPPDFEAEGPIRYTHRTDGHTDIYFVANRSEQSGHVDCTFRVAGRQPELWHPVTGQRRTLACRPTQDKRTTVPLRFEPLESYFIIFRQPEGAQERGGTNFPDLQEVQEITGPWEVEFHADWGAPEQTTFATLDDWTKRPEPGLRYYSGQATYRKTFELAVNPQRPSGERLFLNLGVVKNLARVRLNGKDLGVVWCAPWRVEVTHAVRSGLNQLEITVANLWVNRLIGDAALPADQRLTWTSKNPYGPDSPLLESGLLGPVTIVGQLP